MKKLLALFAAIIISINLPAQAPNRMSYQAVIRNSTNALVVNQAVRMRISILQGSATGTPVYSEIHTPTTNANGLVSVEIGGGSSPSGNFSTIDWGAASYYVKTETDPTGGTTYTITGTSQLLSVPYALYAKSAGSVGSNTASALVLPSIVTNPVTGISSNGARLSGNITNTNGSNIMEKGFIYSAKSRVGITDTSFSGKIFYKGNLTSGVFDSSIFVSEYYVDSMGNYLDTNSNYSKRSLLQPNTTYYVRAYAVTENNICVFGNEVAFKTLPVGQQGPGGGIVFFDKGVFTNGWRYLECAPSDQSTGILWGCQNAFISGTKANIGSGEFNTALIVAGCNDASFPAKICDNLILGGQVDWFLPSVNELSLMLFNLHTIGKGNFVLYNGNDPNSSSTNTYWTSSFINNIYGGFGWVFGSIYTYDSKQYYIHGLETVNQWSTPGPRRVRAIRAY